MSKRYSRYVYNINPEENHKMIEEMMARPKKQQQVYFECAGCHKKVDEFDSIYVYLKCDHWSCFNCVDMMADYNLQKWGSPWFECSLCIDSTNPVYEFDDRLVLEKDMLEFKLRFSEKNVLKRKHEHIDPDNILANRARPSKSKKEYLALKGLIELQAKPELYAIKQEPTLPDEALERVRQLGKLLEGASQRISKLLENKA